MRKVMAAFAGLGAGLLLVTAAQADGYERGAKDACCPSWTGVYAGLHAGGGWGQVAWPTVFSGGFITVSGGHFTDIAPIGGGHLGFNVQTGMLLVGVEGSMTYSFLKGEPPRTIPMFPFTAPPEGFEINWFGTVTGRLGLASDRLLSYVKGGWAMADVEVVGSAPLAISSAKVRSGWTVGAGFEFKYSPEVSVGVEYGYMEFGAQDHSPFTAVEVQVHTVAARFNYRFW